MILSHITTASATAVTESGLGLGSILAVTFSWARNRSVFWAIVAGIFSWLYVIYFALTRRPEERQASPSPSSPLRSRVEEERFRFTKKEHSPFAQGDKTSHR